MRKSLSIDLVAVPDQIPRHLLQRARFEQLPRRPFCGRMIRHIEMHQPPPAVGQHNEHEQDSKVAVGTVKKSNAIRSGAWFFKNVRHACDGGLRGRTMYFDTVACETVRPSFNSSPWILGQRIRAAHLPYQIPQVPPNRGPTPSASTLPCPVEPEAPAVPPHHGLGPHRLQGTPPILPESRQHDPEDPVHLRQPRPWLTRFPHGELLPQREILQRQLAARANRGAECPKKDPKPSDHDRPHSRSLRTTQDRCDRRVFRRDSITTGSARSQRDATRRTGPPAPSRDSLAA